MRHHLVGAGLVDLHEARPLLVLLADRLDQLFGVVGVVGVAQHVLRRVEADRVLVPAEDRDGHAADAQPRPGNLPRVDGVADGRVRRTRPFRPHVALGGEARHQVGLRRQRRLNRPLGHRFVHRLHPLRGRGRMEEEVHVGVDQTRHQRRVAQVDHRRPGRMRHRRAGGLDAVAFHQHLAGAHDPARHDLEEPRRVQHDRRGVSSGGGSVGLGARRIRDSAEHHQSRGQTDKSLHQSLQTATKNSRALIG